MSFVMKVESEFISKLTTRISIKGSILYGGCSGYVDYWRVKDVGTVEAILSFHISLGINITNQWQEHKQ